MAGTSKGGKEAQVNLTSPSRFTNLCKKNRFGRNLGKSVVWASAYSAH